jgi:hypothetical protein
MGTQQKKKKRTEDSRSLTGEIKRTQDQDVNKLALQPTFELGYSPPGVGTISFVNVSTSLGPSQGGSPPPPQVTGLTTNVISNTQINLAWTAYGGSDLNFYTVYRGTSPGFSADSSSDIATPATNSYNNTGLTAGTSYYYRVATTNDANQEGPLSVEVSGTTTGGGDVTPPGQTVGLVASVISDTQINLSWTASAAGDLNHYDVHRSTTTGFTPAVGNRIAQPSTNSYNNTGLTAATTYYYKVAAVDNASNIGTYSTQASGTTTSTGAGIVPTLLLHLDNNFTDSSGNGLTAVLSPATPNNANGFVSPGKFGSHGLRLNYPTDNTTTTGAIDFINITDDPLVRMNTSVGFSVSFWIYPLDLTAAGPAKRTLVVKNDDTNNKWSLQVDTAGVVYFCVKKAGTDYKREKSGFVESVWQHVCAVFNGATNTVELYKDGVAGVASTAAPQYTGSATPDITVGVQVGSIVNTHYEGRFDELQYFQAVLTSTQVTNLMNTNST